MQTLARILPHPLKKDVEDPARSFSSIKITAESCTAICVYASIERSRICKLVRPAQPAEYECEPLLSEDEEEALLALVYKHPQRRHSGSVQRDAEEG